MTRSPVDDIYIDQLRFNCFGYMGKGVPENLEDGASVPGESVVSTGVDAKGEAHVRTHSGFGIDLNPFIREFDLVPLGALLALLHSSKITREKGPEERHLAIITDTPQEEVNYPALLSKEIRDLIFRVRARAARLGDDLSEKPSFDDWSDDLKDDDPRHSVCPVAADAKGFATGEFLSVKDLISRGRAWSDDDLPKKPKPSFDFSTKPSFDDWGDDLKDGDPRRSVCPVAADAKGFATGELLPVGGWAADWTWEHALDLISGPNPYGSGAVSGWCSRMAHYRGQNKKLVYKAICDALGLDNIDVMTFSEFLEGDRDQKVEFDRIFNFLKRFFVVNKSFRSKLLGFVPRRINSRVSNKRQTSYEIMDYNIYMFALWLFQANRDVTLITHEGDKPFHDFLMDVLCSNAFTSFLNEENENSQVLAGVKTFVNGVQTGISPPPDGMSPAVVERICDLCSSVEALLSCSGMSHVSNVLALKKRIFDYLCLLGSSQGGFAVLKSAADSPCVQAPETLKFNHLKVIVPYPGDMKLTRAAMRVPYNVRGARDTVTVTDGISTVREKIEAALAPGSSNAHKPCVRKYIQQIVLPILAILDTMKGASSPAERKSYDPDDTEPIVRDLWDKILFPVQERLRKLEYPDIIGYGNGWKK